MNNDYGMMPPINIKIRGKDFDDSDAGRWQNYQEYLNFYFGEQFMQPAKAGERRITLNYARLLVNKQASFLLGNGVKIECRDDGAEEALAKVADYNSLDLLDYETAVDAAVLGDACWKVTRREGKQKEVGAKILVRSVDVTQLSATWAGDDLREVLSVTERYVLSSAEVAQRWGVSRPEADWVNVMEVWTEEVFRVEIEGFDPIEQANPYGFIPYVIFPNVRRPRLFWGDSDLVDLLPLCSEFNTRVSVMAQILQLSGNPILVLENVTDSAGLRVGPGAIWHLPEDSKAYFLNLLEHGGLDAHDKYIQMLLQAIHDLAEMPQSAFGRGEIAASMASGVALEILLQPVIHKIKRKRAIWTEALRRRSQMILRLLGRDANQEIRVIWPNILPSDMATMVANELGLVSAGIHSRRTANRNLGEENPEAEVNEAIAEAERWAAINPNQQNQGKPVQVSGRWCRGWHGRRPNPLAPFPSKEGGRKPNLTRKRVPAPSL